VPHLSSFCDKLVECSHRAYRNLCSRHRSAQAVCGALREGRLPRKELTAASAMGSISARRGAGSPGWGGLRRASSAPARSHSASASTIAGRAGGAPRAPGGAALLTCEGTRRRRERRSRSEKLRTG
jgi:hypothetical protein